MRNSNKILVVTLGIILVCTTVTCSEGKKNYIEKLDQWEITSLYSVGNDVKDVINRVKEGEMTGKEALMGLSIYGVDTKLSHLSQLILMNPPQDDVKTLRYTSDDTTVHPKEGFTWGEFHKKIIQEATYYVIALSMAKKALKDFDMKQLRAAEKFIELGKKAKESSESMVRIEKDS